MKSSRGFWRQNPALLVGITLLVGIGSLAWQTPWNFLFPFLWALYLAYEKTPVFILLLLMSALYAFVILPPKRGKTQEIKGVFSIKLLEPHKTPFSSNLCYKGTITAEGQKRNCSVYVSKKDKPPKANADYVVQGTLYQTKGAYNLLKPKKWVKIPNTYSFAESRYKWKKRFKSYLENGLQSKREAALLSALITGEMNERFLKFSFGKLGLQHLLAISGFHFGVLIAFFTFILGAILQRRASLFALLVLVSGYFFFVGSQPAVQRSYLAVLFFLIGKLTARHSPPLNLLGTALIIELVLDPLACMSIGFQLSFVSCGGILLLLPEIRKKLVLQIKKQELFPISRFIYLAARYIREAFSVMLAVNIAIAPLLLYHFHTFPFFSFLYNLFFPPLIALVLFALLLSIMTDLLLPPLANLFFQLTSFFCKELLDVATNPPAALDYSFRVSYFPSYLIPLYLFFLFYVLKLPRKELFR